MKLMQIACRFKTNYTMLYANRAFWHILSTSSSLTAGWTIGVCLSNRFTVMCRSQLRSCHAQMKPQAIYIFLSYPSSIFFNWLKHVHPHFWHFFVCITWYNTTNLTPIAPICLSFMPHSISRRPNCGGSGDRGSDRFDKVTIWLTDVHNG